MKEQPFLTDGTSYPFLRNTDDGNKESRLKDDGNKDSKMNGGNSKMNGYD
jgi:hypothetical protein